MSAAAFFEVGGAGGFPHQWATALTAAFTAPITGKYLITLVGVGSGASNSQGGSSGAIAQSLVTLAAGTVVTCTHGTPGTGHATTPVTGTTSTISASGMSTLTCTAGTPASPGTASGGNVFNRNGVAGAASASRGGSSVAVYGTGYAATGAGGAGTGEAAPLAGMTYLGGAAIPGLSNMSGYLNGRLLQPAGIGGAQNATTPADAVGRPGGGGGNDASGGGRGGMFAGGGASAATNSAGGRGGVGGGGGGTGLGSGVGGNGGEALSIIEYVTGV